MTSYPANYFGVALGSNPGELIIASECKGKRVVHQDKESELNGEKEPKLTRKHTCILI